MGEDEDDIGYDDQYGTMVMVNNEDNGTMLINDKYSSNKPIPKVKRVKYLESVFKNNDYVEQLLPIPHDVKKDELFALFTRIRQITADDKQNLENFYKQQ